MLLYVLFWMFNGLIYTLLYYFWDQTINRRPGPNYFFAYFSVSQKKEYQMESKRNETFGSVSFGTNMIQRTWCLRKVINEESTRQGARLPPLGAPSTLVGPMLLHRRTSSSYICPYTPKTSRSITKPYFHRRNLLYPRDPILGPFPELRRRGNLSRRASTSTP